MDATISPSPFLFFFFNDTATTEIYTLSLHDALPISAPGARTRSAYISHTWDIRSWATGSTPSAAAGALRRPSARRPSASRRSEEHTSELQSLAYLVCRLLLEKKKICSPTIFLIFTGA